MLCRRRYSEAVELRRTATDAAQVIFFSCVPVWTLLRDSGCCLVDGCYLRLARYDETLIVECEVVKAVPFCGEKKGM